MVVRSPCQENHPADAHLSAHKSVLESANPAWTWSVHLDAPGQRHGHWPVSGTADPGVVKQDKSSRGSVDTTKTRLDPQRVRMSSGKRRHQRQTIRYRGLVPPPPPPPSGAPPLPPVWVWNAHLRRRKDRHVAGSPAPECPGCAPAHGRPVDQLRRPLRSARVPPSSVDPRRACSPLHSRSHAPRHHMRVGPPQSGLGHVGIALLCSRATPSPPPLF